MSTAFTDVERNRKVPKAASAITSIIGMPSDYQVGSSLCFCPLPSFQLLAVQKSRVNTNASDRKLGWGPRNIRCLFISYTYFNLRNIPCTKGFHEAVALASDQNHVGSTCCAVLRAAQQGKVQQ